MKDGSRMLGRFARWTVILAACAAGLTQAHDDLAGTRYVAPSGADVGQCDENHAPCATLTYAMSRAQQGNAVKVGAGTYDVSGLDVEDLLFGKQGMRGGYSPDDHFHGQDPTLHATKVVGADPRYIPALYAHGFLPVDESGNVLPRPQVQAQPPANCVNGAAGQFPCWNIDYLAQIPLTSFSTRPASAANVWGFVHTCRNGNREYAVIGLNNGTAVVDVTDPANPVEVGTVPGRLSSWREVKILQVANPATNCDRAYAYMSTEGAGLATEPNAGLQIIDLSNLPGSVTLASTIDDYRTSHTLYISSVDYATNRALPNATPFLYVAGSNLATGRYRIYDLANPTAPQLVTVSPGVPGAPSDRMYMHDSTSLRITDNRTTQCANGHDPCEVLVDFNEASVDLWDVTDKAQPAFLSRTSYPNVRYTHSGWPTADQRHLIVHDELDELNVPGLNTSIYTLDIGDLRAPFATVSYTGSTTTTDHNGYTVGNRYYVSHYKRGLVIFDVSNPFALRETGYFDTFLFPNTNNAGTDGAWGVYPFLPSGTLVVSDIENGLFLLRKNETSATPPPATPPPQQPLPGRGGGGALGVWSVFALALAIGRQERSRSKAI
ncbi:MAG TPA: choice-of-anchor B family protein [Steroidobacteraceae bacterium]|nr:choice-of-anchor B family protein [Steroidobacteraceae bacterium]